MALTLSLQQYINSIIYIDFNPESLIDTFTSVSAGYRNVNLETLRRSPSSRDYLSQFFKIPEFLPLNNPFFSVKHQLPWAVSPLNANEL